MPAEDIDIKPWNSEYPTKKLTALNIHLNPWF